MKYLTIDFPLLFLFYFNFLNFDYRFQPLNLSQNHKISKHKDCLISGLQAQLSSTWFYCFHPNFNTYYTSFLQTYYKSISFTIHLKLEQPPCYQFCSLSIFQISYIKISFLVQMKFIANLKMTT